MSDEELRQRLDHIDEQLHAITRFIDEHRPFLARFTGNPVLGYLRKGKRDAVPQDG